MNNESKITSVKFSPISSEDILNKSVMQITSTRLHHKSSNIEGGLNDLRLGSLKNGERCATCYEGVVTCMGHFGHITLHEPIYNCFFMAKIVRILNSICSSCSQILIDAKKYRDFTTITDKAKVKSRCDRCHCVVPKYKRKGLEVLEVSISESLVKTGKKNKKMRPVFPQDILSIFNRISESTRQQMHLACNPSDFIIEHLLVPPRVVRPTVIHSYGSSLRGEDDLTTRLLEILKKNIQLSKMRRGSNQYLIQFNNLQVLVGSYMNKNVKTSTRRNIRDLSTRIGGKKGRVRCNCMGKRADNSARSVIIPAHDFDIDQIGIPVPMALELLVNEQVTKNNIHELQARVLKGPVLGGAIKIQIFGNQIIDLRTRKKNNIRLKVGYVVKRPLQNNDWVGVNRHPSLHKKSFIAHRVRIVDGLAIQMNLSVTEAYNADFDGDEMNIHVPLDIKSATELRTLMSVENQQLNAANNKPAIAIVFNALLGAFIMSGVDIFLPRHIAMDLFCTINAAMDHVTFPHPCILKPAELWSGKQLISLLLPVDFFYEQKGIIVRTGQLLDGQLSKKHLGRTRGGIIHRLLLDFDPAVALRFNGTFQKLVNRWLLMHGFSIGIGDIRIDEVHSEFTHTHHQLTMKNFKREMSSDWAVTDNDMLSTNATSNIGRHVINTFNTKRNAVSLMLNAGSKGSKVNQVQMTACVGQTIFQGCAIRPNEGYSRTLSCFEENKKTTNSIGFVQNSFFNGLDPIEFFYHSLGGREGLVDTAVKTATTGYMQRRIVKAIESCVIHYDHTVRNAQGDIILFKYGGDGADSQYVELVHLPVRLKPPQQHLFPVFNTFMNDISSDLFDQLPNPIYGESENTKKEVFVSVNMIIIIEYVRNTLLTAPDTSVMLDERMIVDTLKSPFLQGLRGDDPLLYKHIVHECNPERLILQYGLTESHWIRVVQMLRERYFRTRIHPGEMVGVLAAQSCTEPTTQMCLNTFHQSGRAHHGVNQGIPRFSDLISGKIAPENVMVQTERTIGPWENMDNIGHITIRTVVDKIEMIETSDSSNTSDPLITSYHPFLNRDERLVIEQSRWVMKIHLQTSFMRDREWQPVDFLQLLPSSWIQETLILITPPDYPMWYIICIAEKEPNEKIDINMSRGNPEIMYSFKEEGRIFIPRASLEQLRLYPEFDMYRTISNDVEEINNTIGIEAALFILESEFYNIYKSEGSVFDTRHISLICNYMMYGGYIMPLCRHALKKLKTGTFLKASFEETMNVFRDAAFYQRTDQMTGVSEKLFIGRSDWGGTGMCDIVNQESKEEKEEGIVFSVNPDGRVAVDEILPIPHPIAFDHIKYFQDMGIDQYIGQKRKLRSDPFVIPDLPPIYVHHESKEHSTVSDSVDFITDSPSYDFDTTQSHLTIHSPEYVPNSPDYVPNSPSYIDNDGFQIETSLSPYKPC